MIAVEIKIDALQRAVLISILLAAQRMRFAPRDDSTKYTFGHYFSLNHQYGNNIFGNIMWKVRGKACQRDELSTSAGTCTWKKDHTNVNILLQPNTCNSGACIII